MMVLIFAIAALLVCILLFLSIMINVNVISNYAFRKRKIKFRPQKRPRAAAISSPLLHDALFAHHEDNRTVGDEHPKNA